MKTNPDTTLSPSCAACKHTSMLVVTQAYGQYYGETSCHNPKDTSHINRGRDLSYFCNLFEPRKGPKPWADGNGRPMAEDKALAMLANDQAQAARKRL
jgi:hypothetical protein